MLRPKGGFPEVGREKLSSFFVMVILFWLVIFAIYYIEFLLSGNILASRDDHLFPQMVKYLVALGVSMALFLKLVRAGRGMLLSNLSFGIASSVCCSKIH